VSPAAVGIVIVSHSATLARGVAQLAREMGGPDVKLEAVGGLDMPEQPMGTDAVLVLKAIERAWSDDGVLVLMDLGSAVLSTEMALDMLPEDKRAQVVLSEAPLVEGAVAAAVSARLGSSIGEVAGEARGGLEGKAAHLGVGRPIEAPPANMPPGGEERTARITIRNPLGLHARPAARFVQTVGTFDVRIEVSNLNTGRGPASGRSLTSLATLGVRQGHGILVSATGPQSAEALKALEDLAKRNFDEGGMTHDISAAPSLVADEAEAEAPARSVESAARVAAAVAPPGERLVGLPGSPGVASGPARHFLPPVLDIPSGRSDDPQGEWEDLQRALDQVRKEIEETRASVAARAGGYQAGIFDAHLLFLQDEALLDPARRMIFRDRRNAADAWNEVAERTAAEYEALDDEYLRARAADVRAVARQVVVRLLGQGSARPGLAEQGILLAGDLTPADTAGLDPNRVVAIATASGGPTSHSAILARSLGIPAVVGAGQTLLAVPEGTALLIDGSSGFVYVQPSVEVVADHEELARARLESQRVAASAAHEPAITRDGLRIEVVANVGGPDDVVRALAAGAEGVGLLRTEFLFLDRASMPTEEEQFEAYRSIAEALKGRPLILRTLDVGADKPLPYLPRKQESNPFLGVRGIRQGLQERSLLRTQIRAALRVAADHPLSVMFPMVATIQEFRDAAGLVAEVHEQLSEEGARVHQRIRIGVMVEIPSTALTAERFAAEVDFFSLGTNDLSQYTMAAERGNEQVATLADPLQPAVLHLIDHVCRAAEAHGKSVGVCGEVGGDPLAAPLLIGLGVRELSMGGPSIPVVKQAIREIDSAQARDLAKHALALDSATAIRELLAGTS
jgi:phosphocarrier protein FPr